MHRFKNKMFQYVCVAVHTAYGEPKATCKFVNLIDITI